MCDNIAVPADRGHSAGLACHNTHDRRQLYTLYCVLYLIMIRDSLPVVLVHSGAVCSWKSL